MPHLSATHRPWAETPLGKAMPHGVPPRGTPAHGWHQPAMLGAVQGALFAQGGKNVSVLPILASLQRLWLQRC